MHPHVAPFVAGAALAAVVALLVSRHSTKRCRLSLKEDDESGDAVGVTRFRLDEGDLIDVVASPKAGAIVTFSGVTRDNFDGKEVTRLE